MEENQNTLSGYNLDDTLEAVAPQENQDDSMQEHVEATEQEKTKQDSDKADNLRRLREKSERAEKERDEAIHLLKEMYEKQNKLAQNNNNAPDADDDIRINDDDLVEGKHLSKFQKKIKRLEDQIKNYERQSQEASTESRLKSHYNDFDKVVNTDNISLLREQYPEIADSIASNPNLYNKAVAAYTMIKKLGIAPDDHYSNDRAIAQKNATKPKPLASVNAQQGDSPLSRANAFANGLTDDLKAQLRKEMEEARKYR